jgi:hypothetical protein
MSCFRGAIRPVRVIYGCTAAITLAGSLIAFHQRRFVAHRPLKPIPNGDGRRVARPITAVSTQRMRGADAAPTAASDLLTQHGVDIKKVRKRCPAAVRYDVTRVQSVLRFLSANHFDPAKTLNKEPQVLRVDPKVLAPNLALLQTLPIDVKKAVESCPRLLYLPIKTIQSKMDALALLGFNPEIMLGRCSAIVTRGDDTIRRHVAFLQEIGLDANRIVPRQPQVIGLDIDRTLRPTIKFLTKDMGRPLKEIEDTPTALLYSLKERIQPRHWYMMEHGTRKDYKLSTLLHCNDERYAWIVARRPLEHYHQWLKSFLF